jgi:hypothetical protein
MGFRPEKITVVVNEEYVLDNNLKGILNSLPCLTFAAPPTQSSVATFLAFSEARETKEKLLVLFGDALLEVRHLERLLGGGSQNSLLVRSPMRISEAGLKIHADGSGKVVASFEYEQCPWPWTIFSGAMLLDPEVLPGLVSSSHNSKTGESIAELFLRNARIGSVGLVDADRSPAQGLTPPWINSELRGGSLASLERRDIVVKKARGPAAAKLRNEIEWLRALPSGVKPFFTQVLSSNFSEDEASYEMPYYPHPSLRNKLIFGSFSPEGVADLLDEVLSFLFERIYSVELSRGTFDWFATKHLDRVVERTKLAAKVSSTLGKLIQAKEIIVNGRSVANPIAVVQKIRDNRALMRKLEPDSLRMVHGDLHFQNILVPDSQHSTPFMLVDPRGELEGSDIYYDMGKLFHSFRGNYDLLHTRQFDLFIPDNRTIKQTENHFYADLTFPSQVLQERYAAVENILTPRILRHLSEFGESPSDAHLKTLASEGMHFSSLMPFHLSGSEPEEKAVAMYLTGALLLDDFLKLVDSD